MNCVCQNEYGTVVSLRRQTCLNWQTYVIMHLRVPWRTLSPYYIFNTIIQSWWYYGMAWYFAEMTYPRVVQPAYELTIQNFAERLNGSLVHL